MQEPGVRKGASEEGMDEEHSRHDDNGVNDKLSSEQNQDRMEDSFLISSRLETDTAGTMVYTSDMSLDVVQPRAKTHCSRLHRNEIHLEERS